MKFPEPSCKVCKSEEEASKKDFCNHLESQGIPCVWKEVKRDE